MSTLSPSPPLSPPPPLSANPTAPTSPTKPAPRHSASSSDIEPIENPNPTSSKISIKLHTSAVNGADVDPADAENSQARAAEARGRYEEDLAKHSYVPPKADKPQDDWQVAYVWAFIVKFSMKERIKRLECLEDFERALVEPVANRPDDILEGILIRFLGNLKPGLRNLEPNLYMLLIYCSDAYNSCTNVQHHLSNHISDQLLSSSEFTIWDRPWAPNEEARADCCNKAANRLELGRLRYKGEPPGERVERNPLRQIEKRGGGLFELDWRERAGLLRQLVDWQLNHCDHIRAIINKENHAPLPKGMTVSENQGKVGIEPLGMDRNKQRIWMLDNSGRIYRSGNPFKRPCPVIAISSNKSEMQEQIDRWAEYGTTPKPSLKSSEKAKSKPEVLAIKKTIKGIEDEAKLAEAVGGLMEAVEKEDARIARARKRIADNAKFAEQAEFRSTRTRRTTKKIDYSYDGDADDGDEWGFEAPRRSRRDPVQAASTSRLPVIPGERKSARLTEKEQEDSVSFNDEANGRSSIGTDSRQVSPVKNGDVIEDEDEDGDGEGTRKKRKTDAESESGDEYAPNGDGGVGDVDQETESEYDEPQGNGGMEVEV